MEGQGDQKLRNLSSMTKVDNGYPQAVGQACSLDSGSRHRIKMPDVIKKFQKICVQLLSATRWKIRARSKE